MSMRRVLCVSGALLALCGCFGNVDQLKRDLRAERLARLQAWRTERAGKNDQMQTLTGPLSLENSILTAIGNSRDIQIAVQEREKADAKVVEAYAQAIPRVELVGNYTRLDQAPTMGSGSNGYVDNYSVGTNITQPIYRGGSIGAGVRAAKVYTVLVDEQLRGSFQNVIYAVRRGYYDACLAVELQLASAEAVKVAQRHLEDVRKQFLAGTVSAYDVLSAEVELKNLIAQDVQNQNAVQVALTNLYNLMGVSQESAITLTDTLAYRPFREATMEDAVDLAYLQQTDILQSDLNVLLQKEALVVAKSGYFPTLDAFFNPQLAKPDPHDTSNNVWAGAWSAGLNVKYVLFEGFATVARVRQAKATLKQSELQRTNAEQRVLLLIRQAILNLQYADQFVQSQQANVQQAEEALRLAELGFREGVRKEVEVADARRSLISARANRAQAYYNHEVARLLYEQATGTIEPPDVEEKRPPEPAAGRPAPQQTTPKPAAPQPPPAKTP